ncbi:biotin/lipoyl-containing protein [Enhygromyxa salina]|uniref:biotin/lipoyl-containing protein n=1 Tax=Enhygromyxa salina TaxID=215803 RepID=UPI002467CC28|nr:biotin/lipoyl-containing protein [Enhygromyxa salina]
MGEREHEVEVETDAAGEQKIFVDGHAFEVAEAGAHALRVSPHGPEDASQLPVTLAGEPRPSEAWVAGQRVRLSVQTEQEARLAAALGTSAGATGSGSLTAPMPGRVVKILIAVGERVELGAPAIIVEAMKMENELHAPSAGVVRSVAVAEGDTVDAGQLLIELAPDDSDEAEG